MDCIKIMDDIVEKIFGKLKDMSEACEIYENKDSYLYKFNETTYLLDKDKRKEGLIHIDVNLLFEYHRSLTIKNKLFLYEIQNDYKSEISIIEVNDRFFLDSIDTVELDGNTKYAILPFQRTPYSINRNRKITLPENTPNAALMKKIIILKDPIFELFGQIDDNSENPFDCWSSESME